MKQNIGAGIIGMILCWFLHYYLMIGEGYHYTELKAFGYLIAGLLGFILVSLLGKISKWLNTLISWQQHAGLRILIEVFIVIFLSYSLFYFFYSLPTSTLVSPANTLAWTPDLNIKLLLLCALGSILYSVSHMGLFSYQQYGHSKSDEIFTQKENFLLQMSALKKHLSPHFLFNNLNTISALIYTDVDKAEQYIRDMADIYHHTLQYHDESLVDIAIELDLVKSYIDMMKIRHGQYIQLDTSDLNTKDKKTLPLTLQLLVENAIKHNAISATSILQIRIQQIGNFIVVSNNTNPKTKLQNSPKLGLANIQKRYALVTPTPIKVEHLDDSFSVSIPILS